MSDHDGGDNKFMTGLLIGFFLGLVLGMGSAGVFMMRANWAAKLEAERSAAIAAEAGVKQVETEKRLQDAMDRLREVAQQPQKEAEKEP